MPQKKPQNAPATCSKHPKYKAMRPPSTGCPQCITIWSAKMPAKPKARGGGLDADALIMAAQARHSAPKPPEAALAELHKILEYNDNTSPRKRVSISATVELMNKLGWHGSRAALDNYCTRELKRKSYATA